MERGVWKRTEKRKVKMCIIQRKKKVNEQFEDMNGNRKLFWKVVSNTKGGKVESCCRVKDGNGRLAQGEDKARKIWKEYFEDLYNIDTQEQVGVHMCGIHGIQRGNYFRGEQMEELRLWGEWANSKMEMQQVMMRSQEK